MKNIVKENGKIWEVELQTLDGRHKKMTLIGTYQEEDNNEEETKKRVKKK